MKNNKTKANTFVVTIIGNTIQATTITPAADI